MKLDRFIRSAIAFVIVLVFVIAIAALIFVTESALNVWDRLLAGPPFILYAYLSVLLLLVLTALWLVWKLVVRRSPLRRRPNSVRPLTKAEIETRLQDAESVGVDVTAARKELQALAARQAEGSIHLCFFGEISTGKSSLIKALVPDADVQIDVVGGSTNAVRHYRWRNLDGVEILLTDVPGTGSTQAGLDALAIEEARRAHVVLFVCDGDLSRAETNAVRALLTFDKPLVLVLNKADRFDVREQAMLMQKLLERMDGLGGTIERDRVVAVSAGGEVDAVTRGVDGSETAIRRQRAADVGVLIVAVNRLLAEQSDVVDTRRERAVFRLTADKIAAAEEQFRQQRSEQIIRSATRKAIIGSMAAVSPGTDIFIQGYVGTTMTQALCKLYGSTPRDLDVEEFLSLSQSRVGRALPLSLAVAGNGLKAFPGVGTVAGGLVHAVAYGLIFDALGRSLVITLKKHGELDPQMAAEEFEEGISEHIQAGARRIAGLALEQKSLDPK